MPRATNGPCSPSVNGKPRSSSWRSAESLRRLLAGLLEHADARPCARARPRETAPCRRRSAAAACPAPAIASRLITASAFSRYGELSAKWAAPSAPKAPPSVETKTSVWVGCACTSVAPPTGAYGRASSISAPVPEALSFAPRPSPLLSRCAVITIVCVGRPVDDRDEVLQLDLAATRDLRREAIHPRRLEAVELELVGDPAGGSQAAGRARRPVRVLARELAGQLLGDRGVEGRRQRRRRERLRAGDAEGGQQERQGDQQPGSAHEPCIHRPLDGAAAGAPARRERSSGRRHCTGQCRERPRPSLAFGHGRHVDHPARRRRGLRPEAPDVPAGAGRLQGRARARRRGGARALRRGGRRSRRPRPDAAEARRPRGLQAPACREHRADHHAHGPRRRARQGAGARARRRRLHHEAVLDPRVPQPRARAAAPGVGAASGRTPRRRGDRGR